MAGRTCFRDEAPDLAPGLGRHVNSIVMSAVYLGCNKPTFKPNAIKEPTSRSRPSSHPPTFLTNVVITLSPPIIATQSSTSLASMDAIPLSAGPITLGVTTAIITSLIQSLGLTLQRKSHVKEESKPLHQRRRPFRRGLWRLGLTIFLVSNILGSSVQITTLPLVILAPLQASGLIFNAILASLLLGEGFTRLSLAGTLLVSVGAGLIAGFGALEEPSHNLRELLSMFNRTPFLIWMGIQVGIVIAILIVSRLLLISIRRKSAIMDSAGLGFMAISSLAVGRKIKRLKIVRGCILGCLSGLISAHCLLLAKTAVELVIRSILDKNQFSQWQSWIIVLSLLILELAQVLPPPFFTPSDFGIVILFKLWSPIMFNNHTISPRLLHLQHNLHPRRPNLLPTNLPSHTPPNNLRRNRNDNSPHRRPFSLLASFPRTRSPANHPPRSKSLCHRTSVRTFRRRWRV